MTTPDPVAMARGAEIIEHELQHSMIMPRPAEAIRKILAALEIVATAPELPRDPVLATGLQTRARVLTELGELGTKSEDHGSASQSSTGPTPSTSARPEPRSVSHTRRPSSSARSSSLIGCAPSTCVAWSGQVNTPTRRR